MIPETPKEFDDKSHEDVVFNALKNNYIGDDDYYVFHSYNAVAINHSDNTLYDRELDFVIANQTKGILCIEVKAGANIFYSANDREWHYSSGRIMQHGGPYKQIASATRALRTKVTDNFNSKVRALSDKCRFGTAVLFVDMPQAAFVGQSLPEEVTLETTMTVDNLANIWDKIDNIYNIKLPRERYNASLAEGMNVNEFKLLLEKVLCPEFHLIPSAETTNTLIKYRLRQLIREQYRILDFLEEQPSAVISGAAGTGKTMIAVEKARRHSANGDKVLFLCYNKKLQKKLSDDFSGETDYLNIDFRTISKLAYDKTGIFDDYKGLSNWLSRCIQRQVGFGYKHVIVDEGQDFGVIDINAHQDREKEGMENCDLINKLQEAALEQGGTFYLFYDKYQMIQGGKEIENILPDCIEDADCRLTLHKNCRNTKEIAKTSSTPIKDNNGRSLRINAAFSWTKPYVPSFHIITSRKNEIQVLNKILDQDRSDGLSDVVILSQGPLQYASISEQLVSDKDIDDPYDYYMHKGKRYRVATCITFKGLEADAIVLINLDKNSFTGERGREFYVGTSRAKCKLDMVCVLNADDYYAIVSEIDKDAPNRPGNTKAMQSIFGSVFSSEVVIDDDSMEG